MPQHLKLLVMEGALGLRNVWHTAKRKGAFSHSRLLHKLDNGERVSESSKLGERKEASERHLQILALLMRLQWWLVQSRAIHVVHLHGLRLAHLLLSQCLFLVLPL